MISRCNFRMILSLSAICFSSASIRAICLSSAVFRVLCVLSPALSRCFMLPVRYDAIAPVTALTMAAKYFHMDASVRKSKGGVTFVHI